MSFTLTVTFSHFLELGNVILVSLLTAADTRARGLTLTGHVGGQLTDHKIRF